MFERNYRQRLEADLTRWERDGVIPPASAVAIRAALGPLPRGIDVVTIIAIIGGLLIAAAFLAFIAANWTEIARPARFAILIAGMVTAYALGAFFAQNARLVLADLSTTVGTIIFGAAIVLVRQMYHLGEDFAGGMLLWASGALIAAVLTSSRGALAVALFAGCLWSGMRVSEGVVPHWPFVGFWLIGATLALAWNAASARHLVALAAVAWWVLTGIGRVELLNLNNPGPTVVAGGALMLGVGLLAASLRDVSLRAFGVTLSNYGALTVALATPVLLLGLDKAHVPLLAWLLACAAFGMIAAFAASLVTRATGSAFAGAALLLLGVILLGLVHPAGSDEPWAAYALSLVAMLCLVISGRLDDMRLRVVAGWIGLACVIAIITWSIKGRLLRRSIFLAVAGGVAIGLAFLLGRLFPKERA